MSLIEPVSTEGFKPHSTGWQARDGEVAEDARRKISRDIHDSAIQPYIGLKLALEALGRKVAPDHPLSKDIGRLVEMTKMEIAGLRHYVNGLRGQPAPARESLESVLRRQSARFAELYGIKVSVEVAGEFAADEDLADEVFHIVGEALSNIRRHTTASFARIRLLRDMHRLTLEIVNPRDAGGPVKSFTPRSISERVFALGGMCRVETGSGRNTVVVVEIPLHS